MRTYRMIIGMLLAVLLMGDAYAETEPEEITIHIRGEHKGVVAALLAAVDEGTTVTGITELDFLAATYGLMGIYRKGRISPFYFGYRFRLRFPPGADVDAIAGAYGNVSYIQSVELEPRLESWETPSQRSAGQNGLSPRLGRIARKLIFGTLGGITLGIMVGASASESYSGDAIGQYTSALAGLFLGYGAGTVLSVYLSDRQARFSGVLAGGTMGVWVGAISKTEVPMLICPVAFATIASELWRDAPEDSRFSISLAPYPKGYLAAVATLRF